MKARGIIEKAWALACALFVAAAVIIAAPGISQRAYAADDIAVDAANFPDVNFRNYVSDKIDANHNGFLSSAEISNVKSISLTSKKVSDLKGIEYFSSLTALYCAGAQVTSLDVSRNTKLEILYCYKNRLTSLDVSQNPALKDLQCGNNQLTSLDVSRNPQLTCLRCGYNQITSLDVSGNPHLTELNCIHNQLTDLDVRRNPELASLSCNYNQLGSLDVSENPALRILSCSHTQLESLDVSRNPDLFSLSCAGNDLASLDISRNTNLSILYCCENQFTSLDVSRNTALKEIYCYSNRLTSLDVSNHPDLELLRCENNQIPSLDVSGNTALRNFWCNNNQLVSLDLSANASLTENYTNLSSQSRTVRAKCSGGKLVVDLVNDLGLDLSRVSDISVTSGTYSEGTASFDIPIADDAEITYRYDTLNPNFESVKLNVTLHVTWEGHTLAHHGRAEPTCTQKGRKEYWTCSVCGAHFSDEGGTEEVADLSTLDIPALGHDFSAEWTTDDAGHWHVCSRCAEQTAAEAHIFGPWIHTGSHTHECTICGYRETEECTFGDWEVTIQPTATDKGEKERICSQCGYVEKAEIPATGTAGISETNIPKTKVNTGVCSHMAFWSILMLGIAGAGMWILRRRTEREQD